MYIKAVSFLVSLRDVGLWLGVCGQEGRGVVVNSGNSRYRGSMDNKPS